MIYEYIHLYILSYCISSNVGYSFTSKKRAHPKLQVINPLVHETKAGAILRPRGKTSILHVDDVLDQCLGIVRIVEIQGTCQGWWKTLLKQASENRFNAGFGGGIPGYGILDWSGHGAKFYFAKVKDIPKDWCVCAHMFSFKASRKFGTM